jgi:hypothetical protein
MISTFSTSTPHGLWGNSLMTPPVLAQVTALLPPTVLATTVLSPELALVVYGSGTHTYVVAVNRVSGQMGTPNWLANSDIPPSVAYVFRDSATSFTCFYEHTGGRALGIAGTVAGLEITVGTPAAYLESGGRPLNLGYGPIQLQSGSYALSIGPELTIWASSGTFISHGALVTLGLGACVLLPISTTRVLCVSVQNFGGSYALACLIATVSGTSATLGPIVTGPDNTLAAPAPFTVPFLQAAQFPGETAYLLSAPSAADSTVNRYACIRVTDSVVISIGASQARAFAVPPSFTDLKASTFIYPRRSTLLGGAGQLVVASYRKVFVVSVTGTTLSFGVEVTEPTQTYLLRDYSSGNFTYYVSSSSTVRYQLSGTTITAQETLSPATAIIASPNLTNLQVRYGATWFSWVLPAIGTLLSEKVWLGVSGNVLTTYGPME